VPGSPESSKTDELTAADVAGKTQIGRWVKREQPMTADHRTVVTRRLS